MALEEERPSRESLRSGSGSLDTGFELRVASYEVRVKYWLLVVGYVLLPSTQCFAGPRDAG